MDNDEFTFGELLFIGITFVTLITIVIIYNESISKHQHSNDSHANFSTNTITFTQTKHECILYNGEIFDHLPECKYCAERRKAQNSIR